MGNSPRPSRKVTRPAFPFLISGLLLPIRRLGIHILPSRGGWHVKSFGRRRKPEEPRMTNRGSANIPPSFFVIRASDFLRISSFVIRHSLHFSVPIHTQSL